MGNSLIFILFVLGLILIIKGSDWFVDSAVWFAKVFKIPQLIIGATVVSICTTLPETLVSVTAAIKGETDMAIGTTLGSIITNTGFILGVMLILMTVTVDNRKEFRQNGIFLLGSLALLGVIGLVQGEVDKITGLILVCIFIAFIINNVISARKLMRNRVEYDIEPSDEKIFPGESGERLQGKTEGVMYDTEEEDFDISGRVIIIKTFFFLIGVVMVVAGANLLVDNGIAIAKLLGVPTLLISIIFASLGTSLPELVTVITAMRKGAMNMGMGNIIGANVLNVAMATGASALFTPISLTADPSVMSFQLPLAFVLCLFVVLCGLAQRKSTKRWNGVVLLISYVLFLVINLMREATPVLGPIFFS